MSGKKPAQTQPLKLPKQQATGCTNQAKNPDQLASIASVANRYLVSTIPKPNYKRPSQPNYSSALASPAPRQITPYTVDEPFCLLQSQRSSRPLPRKNRSPYFKKPFVQHISYIEPPHLVHIKDPLALAMEVLPDGWHFLLKHPEKNIKYYRYILIQEGSTKIAEKSSKELKDLAQQLLLQSEELQSQEKGPPVSLEASANFDPNDPLFQDAQDPNDAYRLDIE
ncbi:hypothetical protein SO802_015939 [Lithocarpus litseifolius]|uniref:Uncharacterized protein n=1 Tax=Lithocarpus litseifolius TaxID=425828 RepID=A0AAW2CX84_9ROSI